MNGLIREFFPKKMAFKSIATKDIEFVTHRPIKCLGYKTPRKVTMDQQHLRHNSVALQCWIRPVKRVDLEELNQQQQTKLASNSRNV